MAGQLLRSAMRFDFIGTGPLASAFGLVWTDHGGPVNPTFSAFDAAEAAAARPRDGSCYSAAPCA